MLHLSRLLLPSEVVTACHSLVYLEEGLVGDPQEKATLAKTDWILTKEEIIGWLCVMSNALSLRATPRATHQQQQEDEEERTFTSCLIQCDWGFFQQLARVQRQAEQGGNGEGGQLAPPGSQPEHSGSHAICHHPPSSFRSERTPQGDAQHTATAQAGPSTITISLPQLDTTAAALCNTCGSREETCHNGEGKAAGGTQDSRGVIVAKNVISVLLANCYQIEQVET
ncbi:uncharacterized protein LOC135115010 isoform X1 [Scylla paramamosain]|uniref:uncharacterized protein LOC135115010 isoform X1 n=1 Tax=Scylla paramamosain TaxID=85552 RepID=UPI003083437B